MAKKKSKTKRRTTPRRKGGSRSRVRGIGAMGIPFETIAGVVGGAVASKALNGVAKNVEFLQKNKMILPGIKIGAGILMLRSKNQMLNDAALGFIGDGGLSFLESAAPNVFQKLTGGMAGIGEMTTLDLDTIGNYGDYVYEEAHSVSGYGEDDSVI